jgi:hypothetical protein
MTETNISQVAALLGPVLLKSMAASTRLAIGTTETGSTTLAKTQQRLLFSAWAWFLYLADPTLVCSALSASKKTHHHHAKYGISPSSLFL